MDTVPNVPHVVGAVFVVGPMAILPTTALRAVRAGEWSLVGIAAGAGIVSLLLVAVTLLMVWKP